MRVVLRGEVGDLNSLSCSPSITPAVEGLKKVVSRPTMVYLVNNCSENRPVLKQVMSFVYVYWTCIIPPTFILSGFVLNLGYLCQPYIFGEEGRFT